LLFCSLRTPPLHGPDLSDDFACGAPTALLAEKVPIGALGHILEAERPEAAPAFDQGARLFILLFEKLLRGLAVALGELAGGEGMRRREAHAKRRGSSATGGQRAPECIMQQKARYREGRRWEERDREGG